MYCYTWNAYFSRPFPRVERCLAVMAFFTSKSTYIVLQRYVTCCIHRISSASVITCLHLNRKPPRQHDCVCKFFIAKSFFFKSDFCTITPYFFNPISKMFCNFSQKSNMANRRHLFLALWPWKRRNTSNKQNKILFHM